MLLREATTDAKVWTSESMDPWGRDEEQWAADCGSCVLCPLEAPGCGCGGGSGPGLEDSFLQREDGRFLGRL